MSNSIEKVAIHTLGCKLNFSESSTIARDFVNKGFSIVKDFENANIHIINTCSVTDNSDKKTKRLINKINRTSEHPYITIIGCYAQLKPDEILNIHGVNLVVGDKEKLNVVNHIIKNYDLNSSKVIHSPISLSNSFTASFSMKDRVRSYLKIQDGCDYPCTYCTIPIARGKSRSDSIDNILKNIKILEQNKVSEVVITGVNIGDFKIKNNKSLFTLLESINKTTIIKRFRISSIEPNLLTKQIVNLIKNSNSFLPHFHIPLQSGSDKILKLMKRKYNSKMYFNKIKLIQKTMPSACIGADVIVGFPGETEEDFEVTYKYLKSLDISYLHVFSYSIRNKTIASDMKDQTLKSVKLDRSRKLQILSNRMRQSFYYKNINKERKVLFENIYNNEYIIGFSDNYIRVFVKGTEDMLNKTYNVKLLFIEDEKFFGEIT